MNISTHSLKFHPIAEEEYREYMMKFNNKASYSEEINIKSSSDKTTIKDTENDFGTIDRIKMNTKGRKNLTPKFYYNHKDGFYFRTITKKSLLVKENKHLWNWKLH